MDTQFKGVGQPELLNRKSENSNIFFKFHFKLCQVAHVIHTFIEAAGEFWGDGLHRHLLHGQHCENQKKFVWRLRAIGFIHGNFYDKIAIFLVCEDMPVDRACRDHGLEKFARSLIDGGGTQNQRSRHAGDVSLTAPTLNEGLESRRLSRGFSHKISNIECEEITRLQEAIDCLESDVIGVNVVGVGPAKRCDRCVGFGSKVIGLAMDDGVLTVGFVPGWVDLNPKIAGLDDGTQLSAALVGETVAHTDGVFFDFHKV